MAATINAQPSAGFLPSAPDTFLFPVGSAFAAAILIYSAGTFLTLPDTLQLYTSGWGWSYCGALIYSLHVARSALSLCWLAHNPVYHSKVNRWGATPFGRFGLYALSFLSFAALAADIRGLQTIYEIVTRSGGGVAGTPPFWRVMILLLVPCVQSIVFDIFVATVLHPNGTWPTIIFLWRWFSGLKRPCGNSRFASRRLLIDLGSVLICLAFLWGYGSGPTESELLMWTVLTLSVALVLDVVFHVRIYMQT